MTDDAEIDFGPAPHGRKVRELYHLLDEHFDESAGLYRRDWSDERVGLECRLHPGYVAAVRVAAYGVLRPDPELAALEMSIASLVIDAEVHRKAVTELRAGAAVDSRSMEALREQAERQSARMIEIGNLLQALKRRLGLPVSSA